jgi:hypothetical protein
MYEVHKYELKKIQVIQKDIDNNWEEFFLILLPLFLQLFLKLNFFQEKNKKSFHFFLLKIFGHLNYLKNFEDQVLSLLMIKD